MSSTTEWLVCGLCGAKVRQLFNNPAHRKLLARLLVQEVDNIPSRYMVVIILTSHITDDLQQDHFSHINPRARTSYFNLIARNGQMIFL